MCYSRALEKGLFGKFIPKVEPILPWMLNHTSLSRKFALPPLHLTLHPYKLLNIPVLSFLPKTKLHFIGVHPHYIFTHGF
jgi:hypothetical protein